MVGGPNSYGYSLKLNSGGCAPRPGGGGGGGPWAWRRVAGGFDLFFLISCGGKTQRVS